MRAPSLRCLSPRPSCWFLLALVAAGRLPAAEPPPVHTVLSSATPAPDSTVRGPVRELHLVFSTAVQPALSTVALVGPAGPVVTGPIQLVAGTDDMELRIPLAAVLPNGAYTVEWVTAGPDSHPISGTFGFVVDAPIPALTPTANGGDTDPDRESLAEAAAVPAFLPGLVRWLLEATAVGMLGLAAFRWTMLERLRDQPSYALFAFPAHRRLWGIGWAVAGLALALLPLRIGLQAVQLFGSDAVSRSGALLAGAWGASWWLHLAAALLLVGGLLVGGAQARRGGWILVALAALVLSVVPGLSGHAFGESRSPGFMVLNDAVHVTAAGAWVGGLLMVLAVGLPALREADVPPQLGGGLSALASLVAAFSKVALVAVAVLIFTGVVNARVILGSWPALFGSRYGQTLLVKIALVALTALIGLYHWLVVRPELARGAGAERLRPSARAELALALLVLITTALLATTPPMGPE